MTSQIADMLPSKTIPEASNGKGPTHALKSKVTAMAPLRKKIRTCTTEVEEIKDTDSTCNIAVWNGSNLSMSSFQIPHSKKVCHVLSHMISFYLVLIEGQHETEPNLLIL